MKSIKKILSLILTVGIICTMVVPTLAASTEETYGTGYLSGDCHILLHKDYPISTSYVLYKDANYTTKASGVTYTVESTDETPIGQWANIDSNGNLNVSPRALGKVLTITATASDGTETIKASKEVKIATKYYFEDFEGETIGQTVKSNIFKANNATIVDDGNGGKAAFVANNNTPRTNPLGLEFDFSDIATADGKVNLTDYNINGKYMVVKKPGQEEGTYTLDSEYIMYIYPGDEIETNSNQEGILILRAASPTANGVTAYAYRKYPLAAERSGALTNDNLNKFLSFKVARTNDWIGAYMYDASGSQVVYNWYYYGTDYRDIKSFSFGGYIDNLEMYSGTINTSATFDEIYSIKGDADIARAYPGTVANISYKLTPIVEGETVPDNVKWSLAENDAYVSVNENTGVVSIDGATEDDTFILQAKEGNSVIAQKTINIIKTVTDRSATKDKSRIHHDFKTQGSAGSAIVDGDATAVWMRNLGEATVKEENVGGEINKYASSRGYLFYTLEGDGSRLQFEPHWYVNKYTLTNANNITLSGRFKFESDTLATMTRQYWSVVAGSNSYYNVAGHSTDLFLDIRYKPISKDLAGIYSLMNEVDGNGGNEASPKLIAVKEIDKWFDLRVEFDNKAKEFDLYIDDVLVMEDVKSNIKEYKSIAVGCAVDDIILYTGTKSASLATADEVLVYADGVAKDISSSNIISYSEAKEGASIGVGIMHSSKYEGATLIVALYDASNKLMDVNLGAAEKTNTDINVARAGVAGDVPAGGYAKIFIWDMEKLGPVD